MAVRNCNGILQRPAQPWWWKQCPRCEHIGTLKRERQERDGVAGTIYVYVCQFCFEEVEFAESHPRGTI